MTAAPPQRVLDITAKQGVRYCIPEWLRNEQIRAALARPVGRIQAATVPRGEPIAVVGFGPSLADTWEEVRRFRYVISCSGAHRFLVEHGIVPTWHVEVDPRPHKVALIGVPQASTEYLIASTCASAVFDLLAAHSVKLWHVFDPSDEGRRMLPPGEWAILGGCDVGLRSIAMAAFLGFSDLHIFGLDGSGRASSHADAHPNAVRKFSACEYDGVTYQTTPALLEAARQMQHELDQLPRVRPTFYGDGLIQHMMRNRTAGRPVIHQLTDVVGIQRPALISAEYVDLNRRLHADNLAYGVGGGRYAPIVLQLIEKLTTRSVLDYGCGKGYLAKELPFPIWEYDPAIPEKSESPRPADLVVCTDVLEHIEPAHLLAVLHDLKRVVRKVGYFVIHTGPSTKLLADGRNAHLIQKDRAWWRHKLKKVFIVDAGKEVGPLVHFIVVPRPKPAKPEKEPTA